ncbi:MAG: energy transducer TonB [Bacteroidales bacterium]|jgi:protein TonB|nr:energy transducer TonB [Bacteroidales bacterium]MCB9028169.1 energy transducer TonB [Bacteroidales bacterium]MDD3735595.1 energy transducer TonB [Bacteroidales bacterium]NLD62639.1 energy transducer TonB [Bacteroidales bacterium]HNT92800.1 energy transducer TonB [Bacteroidales bacterium]
MEPKKTEKANLENKKSLFLQAGLIIALIVCIVALEWTSGQRRDSAFDGMSEEAIEEEQIPVTEETPPEEIPPPEVTVTDLFEIVEDDVVIENEVKFEDDETSEDKVVEIYAPVLQAEEEEVEEEIFVIVEDMPKFRGGDINKFREWVQKRVRYPELASENGIQGRVFITFVVETNGNVSNVTVTRSVDALLDDAAREAVAASPKWEPGMQRGRPVRVRYSIPIIFQLQ